LHYRKLASFAKGGKDPGLTQKSGRFMSFVRDRNALGGGGINFGRRKGRKNVTDGRKKRFTRRNRLVFVQKRTCQVREGKRGATASRGRKGKTTYWRRTA